MKELAKEIKKTNGRNSFAEIILIGGAAVLAGYGFRDTTTDIDAVIQASASINMAINNVGDRYELPNGWLNTDFMRTNSYSDKLSQYSKYYRTFSGILEVRIISGEYLIAMKLMAGRLYKNDLSDIIGILNEHEKTGCEISFEDMDKAVNELYGSWDKISDNSKQFIKNIIKNKNYDEEYKAIRKEERRTKNILVEFEDAYPGVAKESNVNDIIASLKEKQTEEINEDTDIDQGMNLGM